MAHVSIAKDTLTVDLEGLHKLWAMRSRVTAPLSHVRGATADPGMVHEPKGVRAPGLHLPGLAVIGTFRRAGETSFWDVRDGARAVVISLEDEPYDRIVVEVTDPRAVADLVNEAIASADR